MEITEASAAATPSKMSQLMKTRRFWKWAGVIILLLFVAGLGVGLTVAKRPLLALLQGVPLGFEKRAFWGTTRESSAAGTVYPEGVSEMRSEVERLLALEPKVGIKKLQALVVPHSAYFYCGEVSAAAYREVDPSFKRVFILATDPASDNDRHGFSIPAEDALAIPGAKIPIGAIADDLQKSGLYYDEPRAHQSHTVESQLPFLHALKGNPSSAGFVVIPIMIGQLEEEEEEELAHLLASYADEKTLFIFSVNLSSLHSDEEARKLDMATLNALFSGNLNDVWEAQTDGGQPLAVLLKLKQLKNWEPSLISYKALAETRGKKERVFGFASAAFHEPFGLDPNAQTALLNSARRAIQEFVTSQTRVVAEADVLQKHPLLRVPRGIFVTLKIAGNVRGFAGDFVSTEPLLSSTVRLAVDAASSDANGPLSAAEWANTKITLTVLDYPQIIEVNDPDEYLTAIKANFDGVILGYQGGQSILLPEAWKNYPEPRTFLGTLCTSVGGDAECWKEDGAAVYRFRSVDFSEK